MWILISLHQGTAGGGKHSHLGIDLLTEILGADDGVIPAKVVDLGLQKNGIGGDLAGDHVAGDNPEAANAVGFLGEAGDTQLAGEERVGGPGGAPEDTGGVVGSGHGGKGLVEDGDGDVLGFVNGEEEVGGLTDDMGMGMGGQEGHLARTQGVFMPLRAFPEAAGEEVAGEDLLEASHGSVALRLVAGGDGNDIEGEAVENGEQVGEQLGLQLVLARLACQNDYKRVTGFGANGIDDGIQDLALVGTQLEQGGLHDEIIGVITDQLSGAVIFVHSSDPFIYSGGLPSVKKECSQMVSSQAV